MRTRKTAFLAALGVAVLSGSLWAQEPADTDDEQAPVEPARKIKVLENPYDISSFYRSSQDGAPRWGFGYEQEGDSGMGRYPIAGYYRGRSSSRYGYSRFWSSGYGFGPTRGAYGFGYRRSIGQNGDLFLMAPAILAPVGPLTGVFYEGR